MGTRHLYPQSAGTARGDIDECLLCLSVCPADDDVGDMMAFQGQFTVTNKVFQEGYRNPGSDEFRRLATEIETQVSELCYGRRLTLNLN